MNVTWWFAKINDCRAFDCVFRKLSAARNVKCDCGTAPGSGRVLLPQWVVCEVIARAKSFDSWHLLIWLICLSIGCVVLLSTPLVWLCLTFFAFFGVCCYSALNCATYLDFSSCPGELVSSVRSWSRASLSSSHISVFLRRLPPPARLNSWS